jgi:hypothetical protein
MSACLTCGVELRDGAKFCAGCGRSVPSAAALLEIAATRETAPGASVPSRPPGPALVHPRDGRSRLIAPAVILALGLAGTGYLVWSRGQKNESTKTSRPPTGSSVAAPEKFTTTAASPATTTAVAATTTVSPTTAASPPTTTAAATTTANAPTTAAATTTTGVVLVATIVTATTTKTTTASARPVLAIDKPQAADVLLEYFLAAGRRDYDAAWTICTRRYQDKYKGFGPFSRFWDSISEVGIDATTDDGPLPGGGRALLADVWFLGVNGHRSNEAIRIEVVDHGDGLQIDDYTFLRSR